MKHLLIIALLAAVGLSPLFNAVAQEATEAPTPEATAEATPELTPSPYAWCGYALLEQIIIPEPALALLAQLFPPADEARPQDAMQYRARPDGAAGILEGCYLLPPERWQLVSLLQQGTGMEYEAVDSALVLTWFGEGGSREASAEAARAYLELYAAEWEAPLETPTAVPADS